MAVKHFVLFVHQNDFIDVALHIKCLQSLVSSQVAGGGGGAGDQVTSKVLAAAAVVEQSRAEQSIT